MCDYSRKLTECLKITLVCTNINTAAPYGGPIKDRHTLTHINKRQKCVFVCCIHVWHTDTHGGSKSQHSPPPCVSPNTNTNVYSQLPLVDTGMQTTSSIWAPSPHRYIYTLFKTVIHSQMYPIHVHDTM